MQQRGWQPSRRCSSCRSRWRSPGLGSGINGGTDGDAVLVFDVSGGTFDVLQGSTIGRGGSSSSSSGVVKGSHGGYECSWGGVSGGD